MAFSSWPSLAPLAPVLHGAVGPELGLQPVEGPLGVGRWGVDQVPGVRGPPWKVLKNVQRKLLSVTISLVGIM